MTVSRATIINLARTLRDKREQASRNLWAVAADQGVVMIDDLITKIGYVLHRDNPNFNWGKWYEATNWKNLNPEDPTDEDDSPQT